MYQTNYDINNENNTIEVTRTFDAPLPLVWQAWTDSTILDLWWAPLPWKAETKSMDFTPGGCWLYVMVGPAGEKHWSRADYEEIVPQKQYKGTGCFCDENGTKNLMIPGMHWDVRFAQHGEATTVNVTMSFDSPEALEMQIKMGFKEGFALCHQNLDTYLARTRNN